jgi:WD40 repeat protein
VHFVGDRYVVTGSKDTSINVYTLDGRKIRSLRGHEAAICCLGTIKTQHCELLASGSDNGCGSVILWDSRNWQMVSRIQAHEAAVTSIVDLEDGKHIATGSYDKKINIISLSRNQKLQTLSNRASVTGMVMTSDKARLVTAGLDKSISIWTIIRKNGVSYSFM